MYNIVQGEGESAFFIFKVLILFELIYVNALVLTKETSLTWKISLTIELCECVVFEGWFILLGVKFHANWIFFYKKSTEQPFKIKL